MGLKKRPTTWDWVLSPLLPQEASWLLPLPSPDLKVAFRIKIYVEKLP